MHLTVCSSLFWICSRCCYLASLLVYGLATSVTQQLPRRIEGSAAYSFLQLLVCFGVFVFLCVNCQFRVTSVMSAFLFCSWVSLMQDSHLAKPGLSPITFTSWNCRGLGKALKKEKVLSHLKSLSSDIIFLQETYIQATEQRSLRS